MAILHPVAEGGHSSRAATIQEQHFINGVLVIDHHVMMSCEIDLII